MNRSRIRTVGSVLLAGLTLTSLAACSKAPVSEEKWVTYQETPIVALDDTSSVWVSGGGYFDDVDGRTRIDYEYAVKNSDGSFTQALVSNLHVPEYAKIPDSHDTVTTNKRLGRIKIMQDATTSTARIDQRACYWPGDHGILGGPGSCKNATEVVIHVPPGTFKSGYNVDGKS